MANPTDTATTVSIWQSVVMVLFTLSMISERIGTLLKLCFTDASNAIGTPLQQKKHELKVLLIALFCGILTSFIAGSDLFYLINHNGGLLSYPAQLQPEHIIGTILTGFFISLGSKFWHDMLDIILQFSNLKKSQATTALQKVADNEQRQAMNKASSAVGVLRGITGFQGFEPDNDSRKVILKFHEVVSDDDVKKLNHYIGEGAYKIEKSDLKLYGNGN